MAKVIVSFDERDVTAENIDEFKFNDDIITRGILILLKAEAHRPTKKGMWFIGNTSLSAAADALNLLAVMAKMDEKFTVRVDA